MLQRSTDGKQAVCASVVPGPAHAPLPWLCQRALPDLAAWLDRDGNGWISPAELSEALREYGICMDPSTLAPMIAADFQSQDGEEPLISAAAFKVRTTHSSSFALYIREWMRPAASCHTCSSRPCEAQDAMRKGLKQDTVSLWQLDGALSSLRRKEIIRARFRQLARPVLRLPVPLDSCTCTCLNRLTLLYHGSGC